MPPSDGPDADYGIVQEIAPDAAGIDALHALLADLWQRFPDDQRPDGDWRATFATAVGEIVSNVIRHSIPADDSAAHIRIETGRDGDTLRLAMTNHGRAFVEPPPKPARSFDDFDDLDLLDLPEGSYGLALARACLDDLHYEGTPDGDNTWTLTKRL